MLALRALCLVVALATGVEAGLWCDATTTTVDMVRDCATLLGNLLRYSGAEGAMILTPLRPPTPPHTPHPHLPPS